ncbi:MULTISPECIES: GIY-YIG nuclease family protein [Leptolyngbya]|uniref:GIY-YIG nuclease family protein n=1 Tax=Leptolyngbya TaxID=47251 RepID=UPI001687CFC1|nr:GIY-YIG nuclease family protein [Leptolyngbya sp. FACHB-1624]MBD1856427.1 GIY-YIG nuclease family protein [Leptolyngbya sp. FACHB-1624]
MSDHTELIQQEAIRILQILIDTPFDECCPLSKDYADLPNRLGIYAVKHRKEGILYIGKAANIRTRFTGGHKAISWAYIERIDPDDIRICTVVLSNEWRRSQLELETLMIQTLKPRYNIRIRAEE